MMKDLSHLRQLLIEKYEELRAKNPKFSRRAFARRAGISAGAMSEILNGRRVASQELFDRISEKLGLSGTPRVYEGLTLAGTEIKLSEGWLMLQVTPAAEDDVRQFLTRFSTSSPVLYEVELKGSQELTQSAPGPA